MLAMPTVAPGRIATGAAVTDRRTPLQLHYHLVGLLLAAGEDGIPLPLLAKTLYPWASSRDAHKAAVALVRVAGRVLPIFEGDDGSVGLDAVAYALCLRRTYRIPVDLAG